MSWSEFAQDEPPLAAVGRRLLVEPGVVLVRRGTSATSLADPQPYRDLLREPRSD